MEVAGKTEGFGRARKPTRKCDVWGAPVSRTTAKTESADQAIGVPRKGDVSLLTRVFRSESGVFTFTKQIEKWVLGK